MKEFIISGRESGITVLKYSSKMLKEAPVSLIYKFIRNKNIELNGKRCSGSDILKDGDRINFFLADETFDRFHGAETGETPGAHSRGTDRITLEGSRILYEDEDYLFYDKPAGLRSQSDASGKISLNDMLVAYAGVTGVFKPSVCNRLDTNTSGIVLCGRSVTGLKKLNKAIKEHRIRKFYRAVLLGRIDGNLHLSSFISASDKDNKVSISDEPKAGYRKIITELKVISANDVCTYAEILLVTGRKHQIRAQMAHIGHPVAGDPKYGQGGKGMDGIKRPMLHSYRTELPGEILNGLTVFAPIPVDMQEILKKHSLDNPAAP